MGDVIDIEDADDEEVDRLLSQFGLSQAHATGGQWRTLDRRAAETFRWVGQTRPFLLPATSSGLTYRFVADTAMPVSQLELLAEH